MRKILLLLVMLISFTSFCQTIESKILSKGKDWKIEKRTFCYSGVCDTTVYFNWHFKNLEYQYIIDIGNVYFNDQKELENFSYKLIEFSNKENNNDIYMCIIKSTDKRMSDYIIFRNLPRVIGKDKIGIWVGEKFTVLSKSNARKLGDEIKSNKEYVPKIETNLSTGLK